MRQKNEAVDIFKWIDTHNNNKEVCWEWLGAFTGRDERGYFTYDGIREQAHHITYRLFNEPNGKIGPDDVHRHTCDNTHCCNPYHIIPGSRSDNEKDKYKRDRAGYTQDMLKEIRRLDRLGMRPEEVAAHINLKFGTTVSRSGVYKVMTGARRYEPPEI